MLAFASSAFLLRLHCETFLLYLETLNILQQIASRPDTAIYGPTFDDFATFVDSLATSLNAVGCGGLYS